MRFAFALGWLALAAAGAAFAEEPKSPAATPSTSEPRSWELHGGAREEYRFRSSPSPDESDHELKLDLDLEVRSPSGAFHALAAATLWWEPARTPGEGEATPFGLNTVYAGRNPWWNVLQLYAEYQGDDWLRVARAGRQDAEHGRPATFDGAYVLARPLSRLSLFAFGGRSEHFFETGAGMFEDWIASVGAALRLLPDLRLEADYRYLQEEVPTTGGRTPARDHSYGLTLFYRWNEVLRLRLGARGLDDKLSEVAGVARLFLPGPELGVDAHLYLQPVELGELDELDNPYFLALGPSLAHARWKLDLYKLVTLKQGRLEAHLGWAGRHLLTPGEESPFNRNIGRLIALVGAYDLVIDGLFLTVSVERVSNVAFPIAGRGLFAVNGALGYDHGRIRAEVGTQYHRYQYVYYQDLSEIADVRVWYAEVRVKPVGWLSVRARYSAEIYDRTLHTVSLSLAQRL